MVIFHGYVKVYQMVNYSRRRNSTLISKRRHFHISHIFIGRTTTTSFFSQDFIFTEMITDMEVSVRNIAKTGGCSIAIFEFSQRGGFHCISLIFLDVYIFIILYIYIYMMYIYICIYLSLIYWFTVYIYIYIHTYNYLYIYMYSAWFWHLNVVPQRVFPKGRLFWHWVPPSPSASGSGASTSGMKYDSLGIFVHYWVWWYMAI